MVVDVHETGPADEPRAQGVRELPYVTPIESERLETRSARDMGCHCAGAVTSTVQVTVSPLVELSSVISDSPTARASSAGFSCVVVPSSLPGDEAGDPQRGSISPRMNGTERGVSGANVAKPQPALGHKRSRAERGIRSHHQTVEGRGVAA